MAEEEIVEADDERAAEETVGTEIRDTDIVFDCPHCGHNLAIDYRGAGLQIDCVNCGESVLVPIPDGMKIDDLDLDPGEILKQLFATRRNLQKAEKLSEDYAVQLDLMTGERDALQRRVAAMAKEIGEIRNLSVLRQEAQDRIDAIVSRLLSDAREGAEEAEVEAAE